MTPLNAPLGFLLLKAPFEYKKIFKTFLQMFENSLNVFSWILTSKI